MTRLFPLRPSSILRPLRTSSTITPIATRTYAASFLQSSPSPPRLPADQQAEFERLQRAAEAALSSHNQVPADQQPLSTSRHVSIPSSDPAQQPAEAKAAAQPEGEQTFSGGIRKGAPPEFEGDVNPKTGEVGGPKNEPLRWGDKGDWSYNGRVTDF
ncbi:hypothetical protein QBC36DRAFT_12645 [Triangularia setosa]|uniref:Succinate dehydrogenase assembly factor 4, mitochondrial n=1 Tax=Triangularia setosa TaxID=2587417 RepID=A0AAN6W686_9PEZI|nr:hypothetical protein QBC36DRAFT_12645 [Podospora setosa]